MNIFKMKRLLLWVFLIFLIQPALFAQPKSRSGSKAGEGNSGPVKEAVTYRGKQAWLTCDDLWGKDDKGNSICNGWSTVREGDPYEGKAMAHTKYVDGKRDSMCREWDRENDLIHVIMYDRGKIVSAEIIRLSDRKIIASNVVYATAYENDPDIIYHIVMADFTFVSHLRVMASDSKGADIAFFKNKYVDEPIANPFAAVDKQPNPYLNQGGQSNPVAGSKYNPETEAACDRFLSQINARAMDALSYYEAAYQEEKGYKENRRNYEQIQQEIIRDCDQALIDFGERVPSEKISKIREIRSTLYSHNLPMGIMRSMPVKRDE